MLWKDDTFFSHCPRKPYLTLRKSRAKKVSQVLGFPPTVYLPIIGS